MGKDYIEMSRCLHGAAASAQVSWKARGCAPFKAIDRDSTLHSGSVDKVCECVPDKCDSAVVPVGDSVDKRG